MLGNVRLTSGAKKALFPAPGDHVGRALDKLALGQGRRHRRRLSAVAPQRPIKRPRAGALVIQRLSLLKTSEIGQVPKNVPYESFAKPITKTGLLRVNLYYLSPNTPPENTYK
jgi:hypothetical protein